MKRVFSQHHNCELVIGGRLRPDPILQKSRKHLSFKSYAKSSLPVAPPFGEFYPKATESLAQMYLNNQLGCCAVAGGYHQLGLWTGNATGKPFIATSNQIINDYHAIGGYVYGDQSTDNGCLISNALQYWTDTGFADGSKIVGYVTVDSNNLDEVWSALYLFEGLNIGLDMPDAWINPIPAETGFVWDVAGESDPSDGHCIIACGWNPNAICISTWGMFGWLTRAAIQKYCDEKNGGEIYVAITPTMLINGQEKAPNGFAWDELQNDMGQMSQGLSI